MNTYIILRIVVAKDKHPIGIVTLKDFLSSSIFYSSEFFKTFKDIQYTPFKDNILKFNPKGARSFLIVQDIMTPKSLLMDKDDDIIESAKVMISHRISGLPIIDNNTLNLEKYNQNRRKKQ
jgi:CBS domain-containing protein